VNRPTIEEQRALVRQWKETGRMLEQLRDEKLRGKPYDWEEVDALLSLGESYEQRRTRSSRRARMPRS